MLLNPRVPLPHCRPLPAHTGLSPSLGSPRLWVGSYCVSLPQVIKEAYSGCSGPVDPECSPPPSTSAPVNKAELEKVRDVNFQEAFCFE